MIKSLTSALFFNHAPQKNTESNSQHRSGCKIARFRPAFQSLESRRLFAGDLIDGIAASLPAETRIRIEDDTLHIVGTSGDDFVEVHRDGNSGYTVELYDKKVRLDGNASQILFEGCGGNDNFRNYTNQLAIVRADETLTIFGTREDDFVEVHLDEGGTGYDIELDSRKLHGDGFVGQVFFEGNGGKDDFTVFNTSKPAVTKPEVHIDRGTLLISGTVGNDFVEVHRDGPNDYTVELFDRKVAVSGEVDQIHFEGGKGRNEFRNYTNQLAIVHSDETLTIFGTPEDDFVEVHSNGNGYDIELDSRKLHGAGRVTEVVFAGNGGRDDFTDFSRFPANRRRLIPELQAAPTFAPETVFNQEVPEYLDEWGALDFAAFLRYSQQFQ